MVEVDFKNTYLPSNWFDEDIHFTDGTWSCSGGFARHEDPKKVSSIYRLGRTFLSKRQYWLCQDCLDAAYEQGFIW